MTAILGAGTITFIWFSDQYTYRTTPTVPQVIMGLTAFAIGPALFLLFLGWVIAGFQKSN